MEEQKNKLKKIHLDFLSHGKIEEKDILALIELATGGHQEVRSMALDLLLAPPASQEIYYYESLKECLSKKNTALQKIPLPLVEFLLDSTAMTGMLPFKESQADFLTRLMNTLSPSALKDLFSRAHPLHPLLRLISPKAITHGLSRPLRKKRRIHWRLLKKRLFSQDKNEPSWAQSTIKDLAPLVGEHQKEKKKHQPWSNRLAQGRPLAAMSRPAGHPTKTVFLKGTAWNGLGRRKLEAFDKLLQCQQQELQSVRELARQISRLTRRVVLSLHNATLCAMGGWAHNALSDQIGDARLWSTFMKAAKAWKQHLATEALASAASAQEIQTHWEQRIIHPQILQCLWESKVRHAMDRRLRDEWEKDLKAAGTLLPPEKMLQLEQSPPYSWPGPLAPHQKLSTTDLVAHAQTRRNTWAKGFLSLAGYMQAGRELLRQGDVESLVLPWIDKFFISSRRNKDRFYLAKLVQWLEKWGSRPLILFWEDSSRAHTPSFCLALDQLRKSGYPFRGIGILDTQKSNREEALHIIRAGHSSHSLFALRPFTDGHHPADLTQILSTPPQDIPVVYDSAWKDDLCFLYAGTQIAPLLSAQTNMEKWSPWVSFEGVKYPFGQYLRSRLRIELNITPIPKGAIDRKYFLWANLQ